MPPMEQEIERGIRHTGRGHPWSGGDGDETPRLTSLEGVGPATAEKLRAAGVTRPEDLQGKSIEEIAAIDGIGRTLAARIRSQVEYTMPDGVERPIVTEAESGERTLHGMVQTTRRVDPQVGGETGAGDDDLERMIPFYGEMADVGVHPRTVGVTGDDKERALAANAERSEAAREADESFNAPVTLSFAQWASAPNRYDYPGVDTIPRSRKRQRVMERTGRLVEEGGIREFRATGSDYSSGYVAGLGRLDLGRDQDPEGTFAHELGHAVDARLNDPTTEGKPSHALFQDEESMAQAERLSERRRGEGIERTRENYANNPFADVFDEIEEGEKYPFEEELFADVFASVVTEPRAARREAPKAVREVEGLLHGTGYLRRERSG